jgi:hypothetical protein
MLKKVLIAIVFALAVGVLAVPVRSDGPSGESGKSNIGHLYLYEKDPTTWENIEGGAWGKMKYILSGEAFVFVFNGHGLEPGTEYTLIYYPDPWPGSGLICFGSDTADESGNVHIKGATETGKLPPDELVDENCADGAKIWLVLSNDVGCDDEHKMTAWNPTEYLFEAAMITFNDDLIVYLLQ